MVHMINKSHQSSLFYKDTDHQEGSSSSDLFKLIQELIQCLKILLMGLMHLVVKQDDFRQYQGFSVLRRKEEDLSERIHSLADALARRHRHLSQVYLYILASD